jgi:hypothetical protein
MATTNIVKDEDNDVSVLPDEDTIKTLQRLSRAWKIVLDPVLNLLEKSKTHSLEEGDGMSIFRFLRPLKYPHDSTKSHNCEYYYAEKDSAPYVMMMSEYPKKEELLRIYQSDSMYIICVSINDHEFGDSTVQQIKIFRYADNKEIEF